MYKIIEAIIDKKLVVGVTYYGVIIEQFTGPRARIDARKFVTEHNWVIEIANSDKKLGGTRCR